MPAGNIVEAELDKNCKPIKGFEWKLKENGTHGKYLHEIVVKNKGSKEEIKEYIETFIRNEKLY